MNAPWNLRTLLISFGISLLFAVVQARAQTTLYSDSFSGTGTALNDTLVEGGTLQSGSVAWSANSSFLNNGTIDGSTEGSAVLPFTPVVNAQYTLSMDVLNSSSNWIGLGFKDSPLSNPGADSVDDRFSNGGGISWMLYRNNGADNAIELFGGPNTGSPITDINNQASINFNSTSTLQIVLNTTGDGNSFSADFQINGSSVSNGPQTVSQPLSSIQYVGLTFDDETAIPVSFDNFLLTEVTGSGVFTEWNMNGGGNFSSSANWTAGAPSAGSNVLFGTVLTAPNSPATVTMDAPATLGQIEFNNANATYRIAGPSSVTLTNTGNVTTTAGMHEIATTLAGSSGLTKTGDGQLTLSANNAYTGQTTVNGGTLVLTGAGTLGTSDGTAANRTLVDGNEATSKIALSGDKAIGNELLILEARELSAIDAPHLTSSGANSWAGSIKGDLGGTQYNIESTSGSLTLSGTISAPDSGARNFVFSGAGNMNVTGRIIDSVTDDAGVPDPSPVSNADNVNVIKRGSGTLTLSTNSTLLTDYWQGTTTVESGTLEVNSGEVLQGSVVTVRSGATLDVDHFATYTLPEAQTLGGGGTVQATGTTVEVYGDNSLTPGDSVGTLKITGNLSLLGTFQGGSLNYELGDDPGTVGGTENDLIQLSGILTTSGFTPMTVNVTPVEGSLGNGNYRLISHTGGTTDPGGLTPQVLSNNGDVLNPRQMLAVSGAAAGQLNLVVSGSKGTLTWNGSSGRNTWDVDASTNWTGADGKFRDLDDVTFGGSGIKEVSVNSNVAPGSVTFSGGVGTTYHLTGNGGITGYGLVSVNSGTVQLENRGNDYRGPTTVASGARLEIKNSVSSGGLTVNGTLVVNSTLTTTPIDNFDDTSLSEYTFTKILDQGTITNTSFSSPSGVLVSTSTGADGAEQVLFLRNNGYSLDVGEELRVDSAFGTANGNDLGIVVGATPSAGVRQNYIFISFRAATQLNSRGFNGSTEFVQEQAFGVNADQLFIARTATDTFEVGWYDGTNRNVLTTREGVDPNIGNNVGFYSDLRADGAGYDGLDNLRITTGNANNSVNVEGDFTLASAGTLELDISDVDFTSIDASGIASLAGTLSINLLEGFVPSAGTEYPLISAAGGIVDLGLTFDLPALSGGLSWVTSDFFNSGVLSVSAGIPGDFDMDGDVDGVDFLVWQRNSAVGSLADWQANFSGGPALDGAATAVPEPAMVSLISVALVSWNCLLVRRRRGCFFWSCCCIS